MSDTSSSSGGLGICGATFLVFLVLKLTEVIDWSWWWISAPLWAPISLFLVILVMVGIVTIVAKAIGD